MSLEFSFETLADGGRRRHERLSKNVANIFIAVARKSREIPALKGAIDKKYLGILKVRKILSVLTRENQKEWIAKAISLPLWRLEREVAEGAPDSGERERARPIKYGRVRIQFDVPEAALNDFHRLRHLVSESLARDATVETFIRMTNSRSSELTRFSASSSAAAAARAVNFRDLRQRQARGPDGVQCTNRRYLNKRHIVHKSDGGGDKASNPTTLFSGCHRRCHRYADRLTDAAAGMNTS